MRLPARLLPAVLLATASPAHDPITTNLTWTREISRLVYRRCASCHRPGGSAFSLLTYEDARPWAKAIRDQVLSRRMPPWDAVPGVGDFRDDPSLSIPELDLVVAWVEGGAPEGEPEFLPPPPSPPPAPVSPTPATPSVTVRDSLIIDAPRTLTGIRPEGALDVAAVLPTGAVHRLLWVREFRPEWNRTYLLRTPLRLPRGSKLLVLGAPAQLYLR